jgi:adenylate cyclase
VSEPAAPHRRLRRSLFQKYFLALFAAVVVPLLANGASEAWFGYRDQQASLGQRLHIEAMSAANTIRAFLDGITDQLQWTVQLPWSLGGEDQHRLDVLRLMRQVPAIFGITLVDGDDIERLHVSRIDSDVVNSGIDRAAAIPQYEAPARNAFGTAQ